MELIQCPCPLCGSQAHTAVCSVPDTLYGVPGTFQIVRCKACRHMFVNPRPTDASLMECYPADYAPHITNNSTAESARQEQAVAPEQSSVAAGAAQPAGNGATIAPRSTWKRLGRAIPGLRRLLNWLGQENAIWLESPPQTGQSTLLEIGCAHGRYLRMAEDAGWIVDGVEPGHQAAETARQWGFQVHCGTLEQAGIAAGSRDCVAMWMVLEHVPEPLTLVRQVAEILPSGGMFWLSVPNARTWERWCFGRYWLGFEGPRHLQVFTTSSLRKLLERNGFVCEKIVYQSGTRYWWGSIAAWGKTRFPKALWPERWMQYFRTDPPRLWHWLLLVPGKLSAVMRCSGRITVVARRKHEP